MQRKDKIVFSKKWEIQKYFIGKNYVIYIFFIILNQIYKEKCRYMFNFIGKIWK